MGRIPKAAMGLSETRIFKKKKFRRTDQLAIGTTKLAIFEYANFFNYECACYLLTEFGVCAPKYACGGISC